MADKDTFLQNSESILCLPVMNICCCCVGMENFAGYFPKCFAFETLHLSLYKCCATYALHQVHVFMNNVSNCIPTRFLQRPVAPEGIWLYSSVCHF